MGEQSELPSLFVAAYIISLFQKGILVRFEQSVDEVHKNLSIVPVVGRRSYLDGRRSRVQASTDSCPTNFNHALGRIENGAPLLCGRLSGRHRYWFTG